MPNPIASILESQNVVILDGALATELERRGCDLNDPLWSARVLLETPELIRQVHADYFLAGADCAITASYQASFEGFARRGLTDAQAADLMRLSVSLALEARDAFWRVPENRVGRVKPFVAASVGAYGAFLADGSEYRGDYGLTELELMAFHRPRMAVLAASGADMLACETIPSLLEATAIAKLLEEFPGMNAWISFSAKDGVHVNHGETFAECVQALESFPQVIAVGVNCTAPQFIADLLRSARGLTQKPIVIYPNSGETYNAILKRWNGESSCQSFATEARAWFEAGANIIGGCCRTNPDHIRALRLEIPLIQTSQQLER
jgi:homocysteine S-methyltransferase